MSKPKQKLSRSRGIFLRLPIETIEALESIAEEVGLKVTDLIKICIAEKLKDLTENEKLSAYCRLKAIDALIEEMKRKEEKARRTWKQLTRSHPQAYLLRNIDIPYQSLAKIERIRELIKDKRLKEALEVAINELAYYTKQIEELLIIKKQLLQQLDKNYKPIEEYLKEAEEKTGTGT